MKMPAWANLTSLPGVLAVMIAGTFAQSGSAQTSDLVSKTAFRVCADPAAYPMSTEDGTGYENRIAALFGEKLGLPVEYTFYPMSTGFVRNTLKANKCDVIIGYAQGHELVQNSNHYFVSSFVMVTKKGGDLAKVDHLADPALKGQRIGIVAGTPPADHMARNGLIAAAKPYSLFADRRYSDPTGDMLADLEAGDIDAAVIWGPIAGPLVKQSYPDLQVVPLVKETTPPRLFFRITMGVRLGEKVWQRKLNSLIRRNQADIDAILLDAGVPLVTDMGDAVRVVGQ